MTDHKLLNIDLDKVSPWWKDSEKWYGKPYWLFQEVLHQIWFRPKKFLTKIFSYVSLVWRTGDYDFDACTIYPLLQLKLGRIYKAMEEGYAVQSKEEMQALRICIKLCDRLYKDEYMNRWWRKHEEKWGVIKINWKPYSYDKNGEVSSHECITSRPKANTKELRNQEREEFMAWGTLENKIREREKKWLFDTMNKYIRRWWD